MNGTAGGIHENSVSDYTTSSINNDWPSPCFPQHPLFHGLAHLHWLHFPTGMNTGQGNYISQAKHAFFFSWKLELQSNEPFKNDLIFQILSFISFKDNFETDEKSKHSMNDPYFITNVHHRVPTSGPMFLEQIRTLSNVPSV